MSTVFLFFLVVIIAAQFGAPNAYANSNLTPKVALHVSNATTKNATICTTWSPNGRGIPCSEYVVEGALGQDLLVYMVIAQVDTPLFNGGITGISMGIEYNGNAGQGLDIIGWTLCSDGLEFTNAGPRGEWPASGGGNIVTWITCQETKIGSDGVHAVVGAFTVHAYSGDQLKVTPNRNVEGGPSFALANCQGTEENPDTVMALGRAGFGVLGINPCTLVQSGIGEMVSAEYRLHPNAPNPFHGATLVAFDAPQPGKVALQVYDLRGCLVRVLADDWYPAGYHQVSWNGRDSAGAPVAGGIYFLHLRAGSFRDTRMMYLKK